VASTYRENGVTQMVKTTNSLDINWKTGGGDRRHSGYMKMENNLKEQYLGRRLKLSTSIQFENREPIKMRNLQDRELGFRGLLMLLLSGQQ
jgi:hypothetical protein